MPTSCQAPCEALGIQRWIHSWMSHSCGPSRLVIFQQCLVFSCLLGGLRGPCPSHTSVSLNSSTLSWPSPVYNQQLSDLSRFLQLPSGCQWRDPWNFLRMWNLIYRRRPGVPREEQCSYGRKIVFAGQEWGWVPCFGLWWCLFQHIVFPRLAAHMGNKKRQINFIPPWRGNLANQASTQIVGSWLSLLPS